MKIEVSESLCYSYLRHVRGCWLVQVNWKPSKHWQMRKTDHELDELFQRMRERFDQDGAVFKKTASVGQLLQQAEIDALGIDQDGQVHAMDVAFHEAGVQYGGGTANRILKKMLRTYLALAAYGPAARLRRREAARGGPGSRGTRGPEEARRHIYFVAPKVGPAVQSELEERFCALRKRYARIDWQLITNRHFGELVEETIAKASSVADTAELFARSVKLLRLSDRMGGSSRKATSPSTRKSSGTEPGRREGTGGQKNGRGPSLQDLVRGLMTTLLEDHPTLLDDAMLRQLRDSEYCKRELDLKIVYALLRDEAEGPRINGFLKYYVKPYGSFLVCNNWARQHHVHHAKSLLAFVRKLRRENPDHPDLHKLDRHEQRLRSYSAPHELA